MKNLFKTKKVLIIFTTLVLVSFFGKTVFAVWNNTFYNPGDTLDPECLPTDVDCDVLIPAGHDAVTLGTANGLSLSTQVLSLALASTSTTGALSSTDWNTFNGKQDALVSGTNIKTINSVSLLGSGDISLASATAYTLAGVSAISTDATKSLYTMTSTIPVEFKSSDGNTLLYLDETNERVGIGTNSPGAKLDITGASTEGLHISQTNDTPYSVMINNLTYGSTDTKGFGLYQGNTGIAFITNNNTVGVAIAPTGNVGIGTTSPVAPLHTYATTSGFNPVVRFSDNNASYGAMQLFEWRGGAVNNKIHAIAADSNGLNFFRVNDAASAYLTSIPDLVVSTTGTVGVGVIPVNKFDIDGGVGAPATSGSAANPMLRLRNTLSTFTSLDFGLVTDSYSWIQSRSRSDYSVNYNLALNPNGGNVGIGTTAPSSLLTVNGNSATGIITALSSTGDSSIAIDAKATSVAQLLWNKATTNKWAAYVPASSNDLRFWDYGGTPGDRITFQSGGNVGIGTTAPGALLSVNGNATVGTATPYSYAGTDVGLTVQGSGTYGVLALKADQPLIKWVGTYNSGNGAELYQNTSGDFTLNPNATTLGFTIDATGNAIFGMAANSKVGIGTNSPTHKLNVNGSVQVGNAFSYTPPAQGDFAVGSSSGNSRFLFGQSNSSYGGMKWNYNATSTNAYLSILIHNGASETYPVNILQNGNVGIGTTSPGAALQVNGAASGITSIFKANATTPGNITEWQTSDGTVQSRISSAGDLYLGTSRSVNVGSGSWSAGTLNISSGTNLGTLALGGSTVLSTTNSPLTLTINSAGFTNVVIPNGNVGIGTTAPGWPLHIQYNAAASSGLVINNIDPSGAAIALMGNTTLYASIASASTIEGGATNTTLGIWARTPGKGINFYVNNSTTASVVIGSSGNVGIGTTSPNSTLVVQGPGTAGTSTLRVNPASGASYIQMNDNGTMVIDADVVTGSAPLTVKYNGVQKAGISYTGTITGTTFDASNYISSTVLNVAGFWTLYSDASSNYNLTVYNGGSPLTAMTVLQNGNVGIGTTAPGARLTVAGGDVNIDASGSSTGSPRVIGVTPWNTGNAARYTFGDALNSLQSSFGGRMQLQSYWGIEIAGNRESGSSMSFASGSSSDPALNVIGSTAAAPVLVVTAASSQSGNIQEWRNSSNTVLSAINSSGNLGIGNTAPGYLLHVGSTSVTDATVLLRLQDADSVCDFTANAGAPTCGSDRTLKKNINDQKNNLVKVLSLRPVTYNWLTDQDGTEVKHGFIAQEVAEIMPELVTDGKWIDGTTRKFLQTVGMTPYIVGAIQELNANLESLTLPVTEENKTQTFAERFFGKIAVWLGDATNGVAKIFTGEVDTKSLCVSDDTGAKTCITKAQLDALILQAGSSAPTSTSAPTPAPDSTPTPTPTPDPTPTPVSDPTSAPEPIPSSDPAPVVDPVPTPDSFPTSDPTSVSDPLSSSTTGDAAPAPVSDPVPAL